MKKLSRLEETFALHCKAERLVKPEREYRFHPTRKWRFDFAWPDRKLAVELEGAVWTNGRHTRGSGFVADMEKYNAAALMGWRVVRFHAQAVSDGTAIRQIKEIVGQITYSPEVI